MMKQEENKLDLYIDNAWAFILSKNSNIKISNFDIDFTDNNIFEAILLKATVLNKQNNNNESKLTLDNALKFTESLLKLNPNNYIAQMYYGVYINFYDLFEYECSIIEEVSSLDCFSDSLEIIYKRLDETNDKDTDALFYAGLNNEYMGQSYAAIEYFESCIKIAPEYYKAWIHLGLLKSRNMYSPFDLRESLMCYEKASRIYPNKLEPNLRREIAINTFKENNPFPELFKF